MHWLDITRSIILGAYALLCCVSWRCMGHWSKMGLEKLLWALLWPLALLVLLVEEKDFDAGRN